MHRSCTDCLEQRAVEWPGWGGLSGSSFAGRSPRVRLEHVDFEMSVRHSSRAVKATACWIFTKWIYSHSCHPDQGPEYHRHARHLPQVLVWRLPPQLPTVFTLLTSHLIDSFCLFKIYINVIIQGILLSVWHFLFNILCDVYSHHCVWL